MYSLVFSLCKCMRTLTGENLWQTKTLLHTTVHFLSILYFHDEKKLHEVFSVFMREEEMIVLEKKWIMQIQIMHFINLRLTIDHLLLKPVHVVIF